MAWRPDGLGGQMAGRPDWLEGQIGWKVRLAGKPDWPDWPDWLDWLGRPYWLGGPDCAGWRDGWAWVARLAGEPDWTKPYPSFSQ